MAIRLSPAPRAARQAIACYNEHPRRCHFHDHLSVHHIEGDQRAHVALSDKGRVVDVCVTTKRSHLHTS
jgi:hypothetical protein